MAISKKELKDQGWLFDNGSYTYKNLLLKIKNGIVSIIRKEGNYPTLYNDSIKNIDEFKVILKNLKY